MGIIIARALGHPSLPADLIHGEAIAQEVGNGFLLGLDQQRTGHADALALADEDAFKLGLHGRRSLKKLIMLAHKKFC